MDIPILNIRRSRDRLIFNIGVAILVRQHHYTETAPSRLFHIRFYIYTLIHLSCRSQRATDYKQSSFCNTSFNWRGVLIRICRWLGARICKNMSMAWCKSAVSPLLTHWRYCSLTLNHRCENILIQLQVYYVWPSSLFNSYYLVYLEKVVSLNHSMAGYILFLGQVCLLVVISNIQTKSTETNLLADSPHLA